MVNPTERTQIEVPTVDLLTLHSQLQQILQAEVATSERILRWLQMLVGLTNAAGAVYGQVIEKDWQLNPSILSKQALSWHPHLEQQLKDTITAACQQAKVQLVPLDDTQTRWIIATPLAQTKGCAGIALILWLGEQPKAMFVTLLQLVAGYCLESNAVAKPLQHILQLIQQFLANPYPVAAYTQLLNTLQQHLNCQRLVLGRLQRRHCRLQLVSEQREIRRQADLVHALESLMDTTLQEGKIITSKTHKNLPALTKVLNLTNSQSLCSVPLYTHTKGTPYGVLTVWWATPGKAEHLEFLQLLQPTLGTALGVYQRALPNLGRRLIYQWQQLRSVWKQVLIASLPVLLAIVLLIPVNHTVAGQATLVPAVRRFVAAPFEGILQQTLQTPGEVVEAGAVLAKLDGREIELSVTSLQADQKRAEKQKDASAAARDTAAVQMARLEIERLDAQITLLQQRLANLELQSPVAGMVISEDLKRVEGSPVSKGQSLFEIAPLATMVVELAIPAEEIAYLEVGMPITVYLDAYPYQSWSLQVETIHPRAQVLGGNNVFIIETALDNAAGVLRPGMRGQGRVIVGKRALGWVYFHPVWELVMRWLR